MNETTGRRRPRRGDWCVVEHVRSWDSLGEGRREQTRLELARVARVDRAGWITHAVPAWTARGGLPPASGGNRVHGNLGTAFGRVVRTLSLPPGLDLPEPEGEVSWKSEDAAREGLLAMRRAREESRCPS